jgi:hypothetical protein
MFSPKSKARMGIISPPSILRKRKRTGAASAGSPPNAQEIFQTPKISEFFFSPSLSIKTSVSFFPYRRFFPWIFFFFFFFFLCIILEKRSKFQRFSGLFAFRLFRAISARKRIFRYLFAIRIYGKKRVYYVNACLCPLTLNLACLYPHCSLHTPKTSLTPSQKSPGIIIPNGNFPVQSSPSPSSQIPFSPSSFLNTITVEGFFSPTSKVSPRLNQMATPQFSVPLAHVS